MATFKVTYPTGATEEDSAEDCTTVEAFINRKFGSVDPYDHGVKIELIGGEAEAQVESHEETLETATKPLEQKGVVMEVETGSVGADLE
jgi:hypothetical protein